MGSLSAAVEDSGKAKEFFVRVRKKDLLYRSYIFSETIKNEVKTKKKKSKSFKDKRYKYFSCIIKFYR